MNDNLREIYDGGDNYEYLDTNVWNTSNNNRIHWYASIKYLVSEKLIKKVVDDREEKISKLREVVFNQDKSLSKLGLVHTQAFILQNNLEIDFEKPYQELMDTIEEKYSFSRETPVNEFSLDVEQINVEINIDNG